MLKYSLDRARTLIIAAIIGASLATPVLAENKMWILQDMSGGLNTKTSDLILPKKQAVVAENVRFNGTLGAINKRQEVLKYGQADASESITGMTRFYQSDGDKYLVVTHGDEMEKGSDTAGTFAAILDLASGGYKWDFVTWHDTLVGVDGVNQAVKYAGDTSATYVGSCLATDAGSGTGMTGTAYKYKISYYTTTYEVIYDQPSNTITMTGNDMDLTMIPIAPTTYGGEDVIGRKVYRTKSAASTYYLLSNGTVANNTATTLTDSDADADLTATTYPAGSATYTPPKGRYVIVHRNRLWIAANPSYPSRIYYSEDGNLDTFVTGNYFNIRLNDGDDITFAETFLGLLTIGKQNSVQKIYTDRTDPDADWSISDPFTPVGCVAPQSAVVTPYGIIYLGNDGIYKFNGQHAELISDAVTPEILDISPVNLTNCWGEYHQNIYYLAYTSEAAGGSVNDKVLLFDFISDAYSIDLLPVSSFCVFGSGTDWDVLYAGDSGDGDVFSYSDVGHELVSKKHADFSGTWDDARYIPTGAAGGDAESPILQIAWDITINSATGTINDATGDIDRPDTSGVYTSPTLEIGATSFDKIYWNETLPAAGGDITFNLRSATTKTLVASATWSTTAISNPAGTDISNTTNFPASTWMQYRINLSTTDIDYTPTVYRSGNYNVRIAYNKAGSSNETSIPLQYTTGWQDIGATGVKKQLRKLYLWYESEETGTLTVTFTNLEGDTDTFDINLEDNPSYYTEYFTGGSLLGEVFKIDFFETSLNDLTIKRIAVVYSEEPLT